MGLLNRWLGTKPAFEDRVWMTEARKFDDLLAQVGHDASDGSLAVLVVYHFPETGERLRSRLHEADLHYKFLERPGSDTIENLTGIGVLYSDEIPEEIKRGLGSRSMYARQTPCHVHLAEHFPISYRDDQVLGLRSILAPDSEYFCYVGLDEAWLEKVMSPSTRALLDQLGMSDSEPLSHTMLRSALRNAQKSFDKKRRNIEHYARSCREWVQLNMTE
jgi:hypothetical protein